MNVLDDRHPETLSRRFKKCLFDKMVLSNSVSGEKDPQCTEGF